MQKITWNAVRASALLTVAASLLGCEATDAAYFNLASQCYANFPNDSWAQQQCIDRGSAAIQFREHEQSCDNAVAEFDRGTAEIRQNKELLVAYSNELHPYVSSFRHRFLECLRYYSHGECYTNLTQPTISEIESALASLNTLESAERGWVDFRVSLVQNCSQVYTFTGAYPLDTSFYNKNRSVYNEWRTFVLNGSR
jgi:hypothetical protein